MLRLPTILLLGLVCGASGCGGSYPMAPVSGVVTVDGEPLANAHVSFSPLPEHDDTVLAGPDSSAITDASGRYTLHATISGAKGAVIGKHRVWITAETGEIEDELALTPTAGLPRTVMRSLPQRYNMDSELTIEVPKKGTDSANFDLSWN